MARIGFIGAGQMAKALARGFVNADKLAGSDVAIYDPSTDACNAFQSDVSGAKVFDSAADVIASSDIVFLAVKPQHMSSVFQSVADSPSCLFVSIAAGVTLGQLESGLKTDRLIRVMPNTPCLVGAGAAGYSRAAGASEKDGQYIDELLNAVGVAFELPETSIDAVTGLSGSGPAFIYQVIEAMSDGGVRVGLPRNVATQLTAQTVFGAAKMVLESGDHPGELKDRVASPGGTTITGLHALESGGMRATLIDAIKAATERSQELGQS